MDNKDKIILDLCGGTGSWSKPCKKVVYEIRQSSPKSHNTARVCTSIFQGEQVRIVYDEKHSQF